MDRKDNPGRQDQSNNGTQPLEFVFEPVPADDERLKPNTVGGTSSAEMPAQDTENQDQGNEESQPETMNPVSEAASGETSDQDDEDLEKMIESLRGYEKARNSEAPEPGNDAANHEEPQDTQYTQESAKETTERLAEPEADEDQKKGGSFRKKFGSSGGKKKNGIGAGVIGGIVGGLVTAAVVLLVLFWTGNLTTKTTYETASGQSITIDNGDYESAVEAVAAVVPQSVVGVYTVGTETTTNMFGQDSSQQYAATGSGFIVTTDGYIVTNQHVVSDNPTSITVSLADDSEYDATVVWSDSSLDLAILKIDATGLQAVTLGDSSDLKVGETVVAIGNPLGLEYSRSVTSGIISALNRSLVVDNSLVAEDLIQTDAAINSGNSGGPLVNTSGEVIGINTYKASSGEGMGFALPINIVKPILEKVVETGTFEPVTLGINGYDKETASYMSDSVDLKAGIYISSVSANTPASKAGLQSGDVILKMDGTEVNTMLQLKELLYYKNSGDTIRLTYERNGTESTVNVTL